MSDVLNIVDGSGVVISTIQNVINPTVSEEINGEYSFQFETIYDNSTKHILGNVIEVDGDYFQALRINRNLKRNYTIGCEHISYGLNNVYNSGLVEFEDTAQGMIEQILEPIGNWFTIGTIAATDVKYYNAGALDTARKRIIDIANLFSLEIIWHRYTISLVNKRGNNLGIATNVEFKVGENLLDIQEEYDITIRDEELGYPIPTYDVDIVDLAYLEGYEELIGAKLGDDVHVEAHILDLDFYSRIVQIEYDPLQKSNLRVQIGRVRRDITDYIKDDEKEDEEDDDPTANYFLESFKIGTVDCLELSGVEVDNDDVLPGGISASVEFSEYEKLKGVFVKLKSQYSGYYVTIYKVLAEGEDETFNYATSATEINNWMLPTEDISGIGVLVTAVPLSEFDANTHKFAQYGVNFTRASFDVFREVRVGKVNALELEGIDLFPPLDLPSDIIAEVPYEEGETLTGLFVSLKQDYKSWYVKVTTYNESGTPTDYNLADIAATAKTWTMPSASIAAIALTAMEKPPAQFVEGTHKKQTIGFTFFGMEPPIEDDDYLESFRIGDVDMLLTAGDETTQVINYIKGSITEVIASTTYTTPEVLTGAFVQLKEAYADYHLTVFDYRQTGEQSAFQKFDYSNDLASWNYPNSETGIRSIVLVVTEEPFATLNASNVDDSVLVAYGVKVEIGEVPMEEKLYLEFGTAPLADVITLSFKNGPYDEIKSITTGLSGGGLSSDISISVDEVMGGDKVTSLKAYATNASESATVNFQAVCMKMEVIVDGKG